MWFWLNIPLAALIVVAVAGIPMWMVIKHPDAAPDFSGARRPIEADTMARAGPATAEQDDAAAWSRRVAEELEKVEASASTR